MPKITQDGDCQTCGACCVPPQATDVWADVSDTDLKRLGSRLARKFVKHPTVFESLVDGKRPGIRVKDGRCKALTGQVGNKVACSIYDKRPDACSQFEPGGRGCKELRKLAGLPTRRREHDHAR